MCLAFLLGIVAVLWFVGTAFAYSMPQPIAGHIITTPVSAADVLTVLARNVRTNGEIYAIRAGDEYLVEIANIPGGYVPMDTIKVMIVECLENPSCTQAVVVEGSPIVLDFDLRTGVCLPCPDCPTTTTMPCPSCDSCCLECPTTTIPQTCEEQGYILSEDCPPIITFETVIEFIVTIVIGAGAGYGLKVYMSKSGNVKLLHKHVGITGYHDPNIVHYNPLYRHKKGEIAPKLPNKVM